MQVLTRILGEKHLRAGLYLEEDDHTLCLMRGQTVLKRFSATGARVDEILKEADKYL